MIKFKEFWGENWNFIVGGLLLVTFAVVGIVSSINEARRPEAEKQREQEAYARAARTAMASARQADKLKCDCWNTKCPNFGDCRKCLVYEMCLKQLPTCQRDLFEELQQHYNAYSGHK